jgi:hypothetical protein
MDGIGHSVSRRPATALSTVDTVVDETEAGSIPMTNIEASQAQPRTGHSTVDDPSLTTGLQRRETAFQRWTRRHAAKAGEPDSQSHYRDSYLHVDPGPESDAQRRRRSSVDMDLVAELLEHDQLDTKTHGVSELRDGWFDAVFLKSRPVDLAKLMRHAKSTLPAAFDKSSPLSVRHFFPKQRQQLQAVFWRITTTRAGIRLLKSFLGFFIAVRTHWNCRVGQTE